MMNKRKKKKKQIEEHGEEETDDELMGYGDCGNSLEFSEYLQMTF